MRKVDSKDDREGLPVWRSFFHVQTRERNYAALHTYCPVPKRRTASRGSSPLLDLSVKREGGICQEKEGQRETERKDEQCSEVV